MKYRKRRLPWVLMVLGALMALWALFMLRQTPNVLQYCVDPPEAGEKGANIRALAESAIKMGDSMKDTLAWTALDGGVKIGLTGGNVTEEVNLTAIGEGWLEVYPRFLIRGRRIGESELEQGARVMMMDDGLAFKMFGEDLPEEATVKLNGLDYHVVGTVRHGGSLFGGRGVGDRVAYDAYIPLIAAAADGVALESMTLSAVPNGGMGAALLFQESARQWMAGGELIILSKEVMRRCILPRIVLLIVGLYAMIGLFRRATDRVMGWFGGFKQDLSRHYFKELIPRLLRLILQSILLYGALIAVTWLLLVFSAQPLYVFTEWVPENFVEWSSISEVFRNLTADAANLHRFATRELRILEFWGGLMRWGTVLILLGAALLPKRVKRDGSK